MYLNYVTNMHLILLCEWVSCQVPLFLGLQGGLGGSICTRAVLMEHITLSVCSSKCIQMNEVYDKTCQPRLDARSEWHRTRLTYTSEAFAPNP
jgi:hypothetical protein